jgi:acetyltransferase-like isoleucine patch superfamily enzyme
MSRPVIVIGSGGHAKVVIDALQRCGRPILGRTDPDPGRGGEDVLGVPFLGGAVTIGMRSHVGAGAVAIQAVTIGADCLVAAGAVVVSDLSDGARAMGLPARNARR